MRILVPVLMFVMSISAPAFAQGRDPGTVPASRPIGENASMSRGTTMNRLENAPWRSLSADEKALRMNRDYDYPGVPTSDHIVVLPPQEREIKKAREAAIKRYQ